MDDAIRAGRQESSIRQLRIGIDNPVGRLTCHLFKPNLSTSRLVSLVSIEGASVSLTSTESAPPRALDRDHRTSEGRGCGGLRKEKVRNHDGIRVGVTHDNQTIGAEHIGRFRGQGERATDSWVRILPIGGNRDLTAAGIGNDLIAVAKAKASPERSATSPVVLSTLTLAASLI